MRREIDATAVHLRRGYPPYPPALERYLGDQAPDVIAARGNRDLLGGRTLALFCSVRCPGDLILRTYDLARALREAGAAVIGGFHAPMEQECLAVLLRGTAPVIVCPARGIGGMRLPAAWREPRAAGRLLLLSPCADEQRRATTALAQRRNLFVAALADEVVVAHAAPGSATAALAATVASWGKPLYSLESEANAGLIALGARPLGPGLVPIRPRRDAPGPAGTPRSDHDGVATG